MERFDEDRVADIEFTEGVMVAKKDFESHHADIDTRNLYVRLYHLQKNPKSKPIKRPRLHHHHTSIQPQKLTHIRRSSKPHNP